MGCTSKIITNLPLMTNEKLYSYGEILKRYEDVVSAFREVELKGATMPYTSVNGNMFSFLSKDGRLGLRMSAEDRNAFIEKFETSLLESHGIVLKEYVTVPEKIL